MNSLHCPDDIPEFILGESSTNRATDIERHLGDCRSCTERASRLKEIVNLLSEPDESLAQVDLAGPVMDEARRGVRNASRSWLGLGPVWLALAASFVLLVATCLFFVPGLISDSPDTLRNKGTATGVLESDRWVGVRAFVKSPRIPTRPLGDGFSVADMLMFSYTNLGETPYAYLMLFIIDSKGDVHWYYPAWLNADADPESIPVESGVSDIALPEGVQHDLATGPATLVALFTNSPLHVSEVEAEIKKLGIPDRVSEPARLPFENSGQHLIPTEVRP